MRESIDTAENIGSAARGHGLRRIAPILVLVMLPLHVAGCGPGVAAAVALAVGLGTADSGGGGEKKPTPIPDFLYLDADENGVIDSPDTILLRFPKDVSLQGSPSPGTVFVLDPPASFGVGSTVEAGPNPDEIVIRIQGMGTFQPNGTYGVDLGSSGLNLQSGQTVVTDKTGTPIPPFTSPGDIAGNLKPRIASVLYGDANSNCLVDAGDTIDVAFSSNVNIYTSDPAQAFQMPVSGDRFGLGAQIAGGLPTDVPAVTIVLGTSPALEPEGTFNPAIRIPGSPSGLDVTSTQPPPIADATYPTVVAAPRAIPGLDLGGTAACGPVLQAAVYLDADTDGFLGPGDTVTFSFDRPIVVQGVPTADSVFELDPAGTFGATATVAAGLTSNEAEVVIQSGADPLPNGVYGTDAGSSGVNIRSAQGAITSLAAFVAEPLPAAIDLGGELNPRISTVTYVDANSNCSVDQGDTLELNFSTNVTFSTPDPDQAFQMPVIGDSLGTGAQFPGGTPIDVQTVTVMLGSAPVVLPLGIFDPAFLIPGSPSAVDVTPVAGVIIDSAYPGISALPRAPAGVDVEASSSAAVWTSVGDDEVAAEFGGSVASAGDVNNDGYDDIIIGARRKDSPTNLEPGKVYVYHGSPTGLPTTPTWTSFGEDQVSAGFGFSVASAGDVNNDGFDDVIIGAWRFDAGNQDAGKAYVYLGGLTGLATTPVWSSSGDDQLDALYGLSVASAGDVNNDGFSDVLVGTGRFDTLNPDAGKAYLYLGGMSGPSVTPAWTSSGDDQADAAYGGRVASAGDVNNDGFSDVIVSAWGYDTLNADAGKVYVYLGGPGGLSLTPIWTSSGEDQADARFGSPASAGDVNNDGFDDVIVGASSFDTTNPRAGKAYLYLGGLGGPALTPVWSSVGDDQQDSNFGARVGSAGDVNNDGFGDVIVSTLTYDNLGRPEVGKAYLFLGEPLGLSLTPDWETVGDDQAVSYFGSDSASAGDVNGDGFDEVIVGAEGFNTSQADNAGKTYVFCLFR